MMRLLCFIGLHKWKLWKRKLTYYDQRNDVYRVFEYCERCRKERQYYDCDE